MRLRFVLLVLVAACNEDPIVPLVHLDGVAPRQIELGDKIEVEGSAFPQGRKAHVIFEGAFHRPGEIAEPDASVDVEGEVVAPDRIEIAVNDSLLAAFCGAGSSAAHTTFEGSVTVVFAAQVAGAAPVSGNLQRTTIDALPTSAGQARFLADGEDGAKLARIAGMHVDARVAGGLVVTGVEANSRAANAGIMQDDVIVSANGVRALSVSDLSPPAGEPSLVLAVERAGGPEEAMFLPLDGARAETPRRFAVPATIVATIALLLALIAASPGRSIVWLRRKLSQRGGTHTFTTDSFATGAGLVTVAALPLLLTSADVGLLALTLFSGAIALALLLGTEREASSWRAAIIVSSRVGPSAVALASALVVSGSLRADEIVAAQGGAPWEMFALRSPAHLMLAFVFCAWARREASATTREPRAQVARAGERFVSTLNAALAVLVFFGGWRVPLMQTHTHGALVIASTAIFVAKVWLVAAAARRLGDALPARAVGAFARTSWLWLAPLALASAVGASAWERHVTSRGVSAATTFALTALCAAAMAQLAWPRSHARTRVDPIV